MTVAVVLLAAGRSARFGTPKLAAELGGKPLAWHTAATLAQLPLHLRIAVTGPDTPALAALGFDCIALDPPGAPLSRSLLQGVKQAAARGASAVLVALADMPLVPFAHFEALLAAFDGTGIATRANGAFMPPAVLGSNLLQSLHEVQGDRGARDLLHGLPAIELRADQALDIDTPADLAHAERLLIEQ